MQSQNHVLNVAFQLQSTMVMAVIILVMEVPDASVVLTGATLVVGNFGTVVANLVAPPSAPTMQLKNTLTIQKNGQSTIGVDALFVQIANQGNHALLVVLVVIVQYAAKISIEEN